MTITKHENMVAKYATDMAAKYTADMVAKMYRDLMLYGGSPRRSHSLLHAYSDHRMDAIAYGGNPKGFYVDNHTCNLAPKKETTNLHEMTSETLAKIAEDVKKKEEREAAIKAIREIKAKNEAVGAESSEAARSTVLDEVSSLIEDAKEIRDGLAKRTTHTAHSVSCCDGVSITFVDHEVTDAETKLYGYSFTEDDPAVRSAYKTFDTELKKALSTLASNLEAVADAKLKA